MKKTSEQNRHEKRNTPKSTRVHLTEHQKTPGRFPCQCPENQGPFRAHIQSTHTDTSLEEILEGMRTVLPSMHGLFSAIASDHELWRIFRQRAAAAFCTGDATSFLEHNRLYPFCFAMLEGWRVKSQFRPVPQHVRYTFGDLQKIGEAVMMEHRNRTVHTESTK